ICFEQAEHLFSVARFHCLWKRQAKVRRGKTRRGDTGTGGRGDHLRVSPSPRLPTSPSHRINKSVWKIMRQDLLKRLPSFGHHVRSFLARAETVSEATAAKYKSRSRSRHGEARTFQPLPTQRAAHNQLEFPAVYLASPIADDRDHLSTSGPVLF